MLIIRDPLQSVSQWMYEENWKWRGIKLEGAWRTINGDELNRKTMTGAMDEAAVVANDW